MKITLKKTWASPKGTVEPGRTVDVGHEQGEALIRARAAVAAESDPATRVEEDPAPAPRRGGGRKTRKPQPEQDAGGGTE